ncbi:hypothetical protein BZA05DRAFT_107315 [Tricharina praecox]|uniref:uncharacterized protein n=1 Tax=Tricharina praecox TaxID=43433 RepID=UPI00221F9C37|nr:uncharacterized protein BZA05DRAFT_107315 [Tricharina praecox]KAI5857825.1 hypothetical protein BZA05DRAFT_107315 [Tricharina praecox]
MIAASRLVTPHTIAWLSVLIAMSAHIGSSKVSSHPPTPSSSLPGRSPPSTHAHTGNSDTNNTHFPHIHNNRVQYHTKHPTPTLKGMSRNNIAGH